jgi:hypothetical protein
MDKKDTETFVLVHGAWHGGWCWGHVTKTLRSRGHFVSTPTLTGLGERSHLLTQNIDFETHVLDIQNHIEYERLYDIILVGHSYGGNVVTVVADRMVERIKKLIFLDADIAEHGRCAMDQIPRSVAEKRLRISQETSGGLTMPCPSPEALGIFLTEHKAYIKEKLTPHPIKTYLSKFKMQNPAGNSLPCEFILCTNPDYGLTKHALSIAQNAGWPIHKLLTGHDAMITEPAATVDLLEQIALGA